VQILDTEEKRLEVIVEDTQLSLAIGKKGQNVRLASKLIGWNIDIKSEEEKRQEIEEQMSALTAPVTPLSELKGVGPKTLEKLEAHGITSIERLADMSAEQLLEIPGIGEKMVEKIRQAVVAHFEGLEAAQSGAEAPSGTVETPAGSEEAEAAEPVAEPVAEAAAASAESVAEPAAHEESSEKAPEADTSEGKGGGQG